MRYPNIISVESVIKNDVAREISGRWLPARAEGYASLLHRFKATWMVWTGKADAIIWPGGQ